MSLFYPASDHPLLLREPTTETIEFQQQKVNLYLQLAKIYGGNFIEIDKQVTFIHNKTKVTVRIDVVVYNEDMVPQQAYVFIKPGETTKDINFIKKYSSLAAKEIGLEEKRIIFLCPISNENYSN